MFEGSGGRKTKAIVCGPRDSSQPHKLIASAIMIQLGPVHDMKAENQICRKVMGYFNQRVSRVWDRYEVKRRSGTLGKGHNYPFKS